MSSSITPQTTSTLTAQALFDKDKAEGADRSGMPGESLVTQARSPSGSISSTSTGSATSQGSAKVGTAALSVLDLALGTDPQSGSLETTLATELPSQAEDATSTDNSEAAIGKSTPDQSNGARNKLLLSNIHSIVERALSNSEGNQYKLSTEQQCVVARSKKDPADLKRRVEIEARTQYPHCSVEVKTTKVNIKQTAAPRRRPSTGSTGSKVVRTTPGFKSEITISVPPSEE